MDKIEKSLAKLNAKEREVARIIIKRIVVGDVSGLNVKKLKGFQNVFRIRKGRVRVVYQVINQIPSLIIIDRRDDNTYNF